MPDAPTCSRFLKATKNLQHGYPNIQCCVKNRLMTETNSKFSKRLPVMLILGSVSSNCLLDAQQNWKLNYK